MDLEADIELTSGQEYTIIMESGLPRAIPVTDIFSHTPVVKELRMESVIIQSSYRNRQFTNEYLLNILEENANLIGKELLKYCRFSVDYDGFQAHFRLRTMVPSEIKQYEDTISYLEDLNKSFKATNRALEDKVSKLEELNNVQELQIEHFKYLLDTPWYKKLWNWIKD